MGFSRQGRTWHRRLNARPGGCGQACGSTGDLREGADPPVKRRHHPFTAVVPCSPGQSRRKYAYISTKIEQVFGVSVTRATETPNTAWGGVGKFPEISVIRVCGVAPGNC